MKRSRRRSFLRSAAAKAWAILPEALQTMLDASAGDLNSRAALQPGDQIRARRVGKVAVLPLHGFLSYRPTWMQEYFGGTSTLRYGKQFDAAMADPEIETIVLAIDSPGGTVEGTEELAAKIYAARGQGKRIIAVADACAASAAYWIGSAADELVATPSARIGSIGVLAIHTETSALAAEIGIKNTVISAGKYKADGNSVEPLSEQARATIAEQIDAQYDLFVGAVARHRKTTAADVLARYGQGKWFFAAAAKAAGMIDRIATLEAVLAELGVVQTLDPNAAARAAAALPTIAQEAAAMNPELKAELIAQGLITAASDATAEASDAEANAVLRGLFAGKTQPADLLAAVAALRTPPKPAPAAAPVAPAAVLPATDAAAVARGQTEERERQRDIRARGALLKIAAEQIDAAIDTGLTVEAALKGWTDRMSETHTTVARIDDGRPADDKIFDQAVAALCDRHGVKSGHKGANHLANASLLQIAGLCVQAQGGRAFGMLPEELAETALRQGADSISIRADVGGISRPADFANILSGLAAKIIDAKMELQATTYQHWAAQLESVADFKPKTIHRVGEMGELPYIPDGKEFQETKPGSEMNWISADPYGAEFVFTPRMLVDDDTGALEEALGGFVESHELTLNRLCVDLLTGNAVAGDNVALFHEVSHKNDITVGGVPSTTQLALMRKKLRAMTDVSGKSKLNLTLAGILVAEANEEAAEATLDPNRMVVPTADTSTNGFRGKTTWWVEPMLTDSDANGLKWYGFAATTRVKAIVYCYQRGYERMRTRIYFNPRNNARHVQCEGRFGAAVNNYRGVIRNDGDA